MGYRGIGDVLAWPHPEVKVRYRRHEPLPTTAEAFTGSFNIRLVLLYFEVCLAHLERNALLCQGLFLLNLAEFRFGLLDLTGGNAKVEFPLHTQHRCYRCRIQAVIHKGVRNAITVCRTGGTAEYPKEEHRIVIGLGGIDQLLVRLHALTRLRKLRAHLVGVSEILLQRPSLAYLGFKHLVRQLNRLHRVQKEQGAQTSQRQLFPFTNVIKLLLQLPLKGLQLEGIHVVHTGSTGLKLTSDLVQGAAELVANFETEIFQ